MNIDKRIVSIIAAGALAVSSLPASAQLLGGGINGAAGGMLGTTGHGIDGTFDASGAGQVGAQGAGALRERVGQTRDRAEQTGQSVRDQTSGTTQATTSTSARAARKSRDTTPHSTRENGQTQASRPLTGDLMADSAVDGSFEREAGGRRVAAQGASRQSAAKDDSGLALGGQNDAGASITKIEPAEETAGTDTPASEGEQP